MPSASPRVVCSITTISPQSPQPPHPTPSLPDTSNVKGAQLAAATKKCSIASLLTINKNSPNDYSLPGIANSPQMPLSSQTLSSRRLKCQRCAACSSHQKMLNCPSAHHQQKYP